MLAGSRFTTGAESRYAPVEGEALGVEWGLESTKHYSLGNPKLLVATDHKLLLKILGDSSQPLPQPDYPFQQVVSDYFQEKCHHYLVIADRFNI